MKKKLKRLVAFVFKINFACKRTSHWFNFYLNFFFLFLILLLFIFYFSLIRCGNCFLLIFCIHRFWAFHMFQFYVFSFSSIFFLLFCIANILFHFHSFWCKIFTKHFYIERTSEWNENDSRCLRCRLFECINSKIKSMPQR